MKEESLKYFSKLKRFNALCIIIALLAYAGGVYFKDSSMLSAAMVIFVCAGHNYSTINKIRLIEQAINEPVFITEKVISIIIIFLLLVQFFLFFTR